MAGRFWQVESPTTYGSTVFVNSAHVLLVHPTTSGSQWYGQVVPVIGSASLLIGPGHASRADFIAWANDAFDANIVEE